MMVPKIVDTNNGTGFVSYRIFIGVMLSYAIAIGTTFAAARSIYLNEQSIRDSGLGTYQQQVDSRLTRIEEKIDELIMHSRNP